MSSSSLHIYFQKFVSLDMDCMAHVQHSMIIPGASLQFVGDLKFHQREPLIHKGADRRFKVSVCRNVCVVSYKSMLYHSRELGFKYRADR